MSAVHDRELDRLLRRLGNQNPVAANVRAAARLDPGVADTAADFLRQMVTTGGGNPDDPAGLPLVSQLPDGPIRVGSVWNGRAPGPPFCLRLGSRDDVQHICVVGRTRSGKSVLLAWIALRHMAAGGRVWIIDVENEYAKLADGDGPEAPLVLWPRHLRFNILQPPHPEVALATWLSDLVLLLRELLYLRDGSVNLFQTNVQELIDKKHKAAGPDQYPSLAELHRHFTGLRLAGKQRAGGWQETLLNRLGALTSTFPHTRHVTGSDMLARLVNRNVVFRLGGLRGLPLQFVVHYLASWLSRYKEVETA